MYLCAVVLLMPQPLVGSDTFNRLLLQAGQCRRKVEGMSSLLTCGCRICRPLDMAFSMPERTHALIIAGSNWLDTPSIWKKAALMGAGKPTNIQKLAGCGVRICPGFDYLTISSI